MINYDLKFLSFDVNIPDTDLKASRCEKKRHEENVRDAAKRSYFKKRGCGVRAPKSRVLREFEALFREKAVILCEWLNETTAVVVFSSGAIAYLSVDAASLDITHILFDRYCVGKLSGQAVCGVVFSWSHLLFTHAEGTATLITFGASKSEQPNVPYKIADRNPHLVNTELVDNARRAERRLSWSDPPSPSRGRGPRVLVWSAANNEPAPWTPNTDLRANLHLYQLHGSHINLIAYHQLENETILAEILRNNYNVIHIVDQVICQKNGVVVEWVRYSLKEHEEGVVRLGAHRAGSTRVTLAAPARTAALCGRGAGGGERLLIAGIDGVLHIAHHLTGLTHTTRAGFIASMVHWSDCAIVCAEEGARLQCFDHALATMHQTANCIHLQHYRDDAHLNILAVTSIRIGALLLTSFNSGSIAVLRLTHPKLPMAWVRWGKLDRAVAVLQTMNWDLEGDECLYLLQAIMKHALRRPLSEASSSAIVASLGSYLGRAPRPAPRPACIDLARLYHHHLLRRSRISTALSLGVEVGAWDLFSDARCSAERLGDHGLAEEARGLAEHAYHAQESECNSSCSCSQSSCSTSEDETSSNDNKPQPPPLPRVPYPSAQPNREPVPFNQLETSYATAHPIRPPPVPLNQSETSYATAPPIRPPPMPLNQLEMPYPSIKPIKVPLSGPEMSLRPNLHQYLERDEIIWNTDARSEQPTVRWHSMDDVLDPKINPRSRALHTIEERPHRRKSSVVEIAPRNYEPILSYTSLYQRDLRNESSSSGRYPNGIPQLPYVERRDGVDRSSRQVEKNVKFSDTVTVAVVPESRRTYPEPAQELADSLPICPPHAYLAAFEPASHNHPGVADTKQSQIKVVHFGRV